MQAAPELSLPCQPRILALLMRELISEVPHMRRVNQLFGCDPVLAAQLMECANSSLLGERQLRALLKKAQAGMVARPIAGIDMGQFARVSQDCAKLARSLAGRVRLDGSVAYIAGLLHGMGQLVLHQTQPERVAALAAEAGLWDPRRPRVEVRHWGYSAHHTTAILLRAWGLPAEIVAAVQAMEAPLQDAQFDPMAGVLHLAVWRNRVKVSGWSERSMADAFPVDVALALGIDVDVVLQQEATDWSQSMY